MIAPIETESGVTTNPANQSNARFDSTVWLCPAVLVVLDQLTKWIVIFTMDLHQSVSVFGDWFRLTYILNPGGAFGVRWGHQSVYYVAALLVIAWIVWHLWHEGRQRRLSIWGLALILGGAAGNLIDRIIRGEVVDFLDFEFPNMQIPSFDFGILKHAGYAMERWPTFNVADSAVTVGVALLLITLWYDPVVFGHDRETPVTAVDFDPGEAPE